MIESAGQFRLLRESEVAAEHKKAVRDTAPLEVWLDIIERMPDMRFWVAQNKTVPVEVLHVLSGDPDSKVREMVARKRKLPESLQLKIAKDRDSTVRAALVYNAKLTPLVREILAGDSDPLVQNAIEHTAQNA